MFTTLRSERTAEADRTRWSRSPSVSAPTLAHHNPSSLARRSPRLNPSTNDSNNNNSHPPLTSAIKPERHETLAPTALSRSAQLVSFFVREHSQTNSEPIAAPNMSAARATPLLRGAQRPSHDPYQSFGQASPVSNESNSKNYDYHAEQQMATQFEHQRNNISHNTNPNQRHPTPQPQPSSSRIRNFSPFAPLSRRDNAGANTGLDKRDEREVDRSLSPPAMVSRHTQSTHPSPNKSASRQPKSPKDNIEDRADSKNPNADLSPRKAKRRSRNDWPNMREGRDDNKIWGAGRKKKKSKKSTQSSQHASTSAIAMDDGNDDDDDDDDDDEEEGEGEGELHGNGNLPSQTSIHNPPVTPMGWDLNIVLSIPRYKLLGWASWMVKLAQNAYTSVTFFLFSTLGGYAQRVGQRIKSIGPMKYLFFLLSLLAAIMIGVWTPPFSSFPNPSRSFYGSAPASLFDSVRAWFPFGFRPWYRHDFVIPDSIDQVIDRLAQLEGSVQHMSSAMEFEKYSTYTLNQGQKEILRRISKLEESSVSVFRQIQGMDAKRLKSEQDTLQLIEKLRDSASESESDIQTFTEMMKTLADTHTDNYRKNDAEAAKLATRIAQLQSKLDQTTSVIATLKQSVKHAETASSRALDLLDVLENRLPSMMPVRKDSKTGRISIEPSFWLELKKGLNSADSHSPADDKVSWQAFRQANEDALRSLVSGEVNTSLQARMHQGTLLSREAFLDLLRAELEQAKVSLSDRFDASVGEIQNDILAKVRKQNEMYEKSGSWRPRTVARHGAKTASTSDQPVADVPKEMNQVVDLIDRALETYSADRLNKIDYALLSAGGRVLPHLTSPNIDKQSNGGWFRKKISKLNPNMPISRPAAVALHHDNAPGLCWPFAGQSGTLGIALSREILITDITVEHLARSISRDDSKSAPRDVVVWGLVHNKAQVRRWRNLRRKMAAHSLAKEKKRRSFSDETSSTEKEEDDVDDDDDDDAEPIQPIPIPPTENHVLIASFTYDISEGVNAIQTFPASDEIRSLKMPISMVQVQVTSNHGSKQYTCLYRVRVHGEPLPEPAKHK